MKSSASRRCKGDCRPARSTLERRPASRLARLDASPGGGEDLARAAAAFGVEGGAQPQHHVQVFGGEQLGHEVDLLDADAVLAGDAAALADALVKNLMAGGEDALDLVWVALVEEHEIGRAHV